MDNKNKQTRAGFGVMILNKEGKVLLGKRHDDPIKADSALHGEGTWTMPGGKLHFQESFEQAAIRETLEETGILLKNPQVICINNNIVHDAHFITIGLLSLDFEGEPKIMEPDEITEWGWFSLNNLPEKIYFPSKEVLENYTHKKFYIPKKELEVEVRSFLTKEQYDSLLKFLRENATLNKEEFQETHYFNCPQDLRIQKSDSSAKIWMKKGKIHDECREEIEIKISKKDFEKIQKIFTSLGLNTEVKWLRDRKQFDWHGIKTCLDYTKGYGYIIELEKKASEQEKTRILNELKQKLTSLNIPITPRHIFEEKFQYYKENWRNIIEQ